MIRRDGQSQFLDNMIVTKRGNIVKKASTIVIAEDAPGADTKPEAQNILKKFDKSEDIPDEYIQKFVERIESGEEPKAVMKDFFQGLNEVKKSHNTLSIRTAKMFRQHGIFKKAERDVYQNLDTGDFWKISDDGKNVVRMFKEVDGITEGV